MRRHTYAGEIWQDDAIHPNLWALLQQRDILLEFSSGQPPYRVVLGIPHHAAAAADRIAEDWVNPENGRTGRPADGTAGLTGLAVFGACRLRNISVRLVIAVHASDHDPNKTPRSPYWQSILGIRAGEEASFQLFELHGAGEARLYDLELSAGRNRLSQPLVFGAGLAGRLPSDWILAVQSQPGKRRGQLFHSQTALCRLENPALETAILEQAGLAGIPALHLEMRPFLRKTDPAHPGSPRPNQAAWTLAHALADVFSHYPAAFNR